MPGEPVSPLGFKGIKKAPGAAPEAYETLFLKKGRRGFELPPYFAAFRPGNLF
jgi:hypothetical protein